MKNQDYKPVERNAEDDDREEKLLDEQKRFQQLHYQLQAL